MRSPKNTVTKAPQTQLSSTVCGERLAYLVLISQKISEVLLHCTWPNSVWPSRVHPSSSDNSNSWRVTPHLLVTLLDLG